MPIFAKRYDPQPEKHIKRKRAMPISLIPSLISFCLIIGYTPGPANLLSLSSALKYGRKEALRLWRGLFFGFLTIDIAAAIVTWKLGPIIKEYIGWITYVGAAYIFYLAFKSVINSGKEQQDSSSCNFMTGYLMQLTNAKMIIFCLTSFSLYVLPFADIEGDTNIMHTSPWCYIPVGVVLILAGPGANLLWLLIGAKLQNLFIQHQLLVDLFMGLALAFCAFLLIARSPMPPYITRILSEFYGLLMF